MTVQEIFAAYRDLVRPIAARIARNLPGHSLADLEQSGAVGLLQAAERYDPARSEMFPIYARLRIRGAILDSLASHRRLGTDAGPEESEGESATEAVFLLELRAAVARLPLPQRYILALHYGREMSLRQAGRAAGISASQARRHEAAALAALRKALGVAA